jgi:hypothetical protein
MSEPRPTPNPDQKVPTRSGEEMGEREPLGPQPGSGPDRQRPPLPEEESYERRDEKRTEN